jgi:hypothetical protein
MVEGRNESDPKNLGRILSIRARQYLRDNLPAVQTYFELYRGMKFTNEALLNIASGVDHVPDNPEIQKLAASINSGMNQNSQPLDPVIADIQELMNSPKNSPTLVRFDEGSVIPQIQILAQLMNTGRYVLTLPDAINGIVSALDPFKLYTINDKDTILKTYASYQIKEQLNTAFSDIIGLVNAKASWTMQRYIQRTIIGHFRFRVPDPKNNIIMTIKSEYAYPFTARWASTYPEVFRHGITDDRISWLNEHLAVERPEAYMECMNLEYVANFILGQRITYTPNGFHSEWTSDQYLLAILAEIKDRKPDLVDKILEFLDSMKQKTNDEIKRMMGSPSNFITNYLLLCLDIIAFIAYEADDHLTYEKRRLGPSYANMTTLEPSVSQSHFLKNSGSTGASVFANSAVMYSIPMFTELTRRV